jgi:lipopolysaccharide/colanic/teichoic acid biosynthesis glycosyltransferase/glycosyltransferase involved in cell wall biosynthesis
VGPKNKTRLIRITTVPISLKLLLGGQLGYFKEKNFDVLAISADGPEIIQQKIDDIPHKVVAMTRQITPFQDLVCLVKLILIIRKFKPDIVHTHTPKAGLLGMLAAWFCNVPVRMHTVAGLPLMEKKGFLRKLLIAVERVTYTCATQVYPNSLGLKKFIQEYIGDHYKLKIIGHGSSNGIDTLFFRRQDGLESTAQAIRHRYGIGVNDLIFSFVGRVVNDKGISEMVEAFKKCRDRLSDRKVFLLIVGPLEQELDPISADDLQFLRNDPNVILAGYQADVRPWIMASDIFVFPSYREGFPNVVMQACCLEVPCIVSDINGCNEIISHNNTGLIIKPKDSEALYLAMLSFAQDELTRKKFAVQARERICRDYDQRFVWEELSKEYDRATSAVGNRVQKKPFAYNKFAKPVFDVLVSLLILIITLPVMLLCIALLAWYNKGKVWFTQIRPGKNGKLFKVIKFRTMTDEMDADGNLLPDKDRLHGIGKFIRKTSLDELPQLINVLKGEMSIVGPRPLLEEYLPLYTEEQHQRHLVKPGITGWAQVNGRNTISWRQKFAYDIWYVRNQSFTLDLRILFLTVLKVFKAEGINSATSVTMEKFIGNMDPKDSNDLT